MSSEDKLATLLLIATEGCWDIGDLISITGYNHHKFMSISDVLEMAVADGLYSLVLSSLCED